MSDKFAYPMVGKYPGAGAGVYPTASVPPCGPPSLEQRLDHLHREIERMGAVRNHMAVIVERLAPMQSCPPGVTENRSVGQNPQDLNGKFRESLTALQEQIDDIISLANHLDAALFDPPATKGVG